MDQKTQEGDAYLAQKTQDGDTYFSTKHNEADEYAQQVRDNLEAQTKVIEGNIQGLKQFETEYRARLTEFLGQLVSQVSDTNNYDQDSQDD